MQIRGELHLRANGAEKVFWLEAPRFTIGRGTENSLCLPDPVVSRYHAELIRLGDAFLLRDLGSTNGSYINGLRISEQMLNDGDLVRFGQAGPELVFKQIEELDQRTEAGRRRLKTTQNLIDSLTGKLGVVTTDAREEANLRCLLAEAHLNKGQHEEALDLLAKYDDPATLLALPKEFRASVLLWLGRVQVGRKQYPVAIDALQRSLHLYKQVKDDTGLGAAHASLGRALIGTDDLLTARDHLHRALLIARRAGNARLWAEVHLLLGKVDWKESDLEGARYNWMRASRLAEGSNDLLLQARVRLQEAFVLYAEGSLKEAVPAYQSAISQIEAVGNVRLLLKAYSHLSRALTRLGSWAAAERLLEDRLRLARQHELHKAEAVALTDLAEFKLLQGNLGAAGSTIEAALERHGGIVYGRTQRILGRILCARGQPGEAIAALKQGLLTTRQKGIFEEQILIGLELALTYLETGDTREAREQLGAAESITSLDPALGLMGRALYTRGRIHAAGDQIAEANRSFTQSLSIFRTIGDPFRTGLCHAAMGALRARMDRQGSARAHLEEAHRIFAKLGAISELRRVDEELASYANVKAVITQTIATGLSRTAPLSMANIPTADFDVTTGRLIPRRVLVAASSDELAAILTKGLEVENYVVECVPDGRAALERAAGGERSYDLLVLDALLEHCSGFDVCRELRKRQLEIPVVLLGSRQGVEDKIEALQAGADDFMSKWNMVFEELLAKMEALLR